MLTYTETIKTINDFMLNQIMFNMSLSRNRMRTKSYAKWAMYEILEMVEEEKHIYGTEIDISKIIDSFIHTMDRLLKIGFTPMFNTARRTAVLFQRYLINKIGDF